MDFKLYVGQRVRAPWNNAPYPGTIKRIDGDKITVRWDDDAVPPSTFDYDDVQPLEKK